MMIFFVVLFMFEVFAVETPERCQISRVLPVQDQDGMGTCASNTASLLMQQNFHLPKAPSYFQMSITAQTGSNRNLFYMDDEDGTSKERPLNWGAHICDVVTQATTVGYCDIDQLGFDFSGRADALQSQEHFLEGLSQLLRTNDSRIRSLGNMLNDPSQRAEAERRVGQMFLNRAQTCREPFRDFVIRRLLERRRTEWQGLLNNPQTPAATKTLFRTLMARTFTTTGAPTAAAADYAKTFIPNSMEQNIADLEAQTSTPFSGANPETLFNFWWGNHNDLNTHLIPSGLSTQYEGYLADFHAYAICRNPEAMSILSNYFQNPECALPSEPLPLNVQNQARDLLNALTNFSSGSTNLEASLINIISPSCAEQMRGRQRTLQGDCRTIPISSDADEASGKAMAYQELCADRAVGLSICTGFFRANSPLDSQNCKHDVNGVKDHARHAVTLIGYRTQDQKRQFLVQNSWGPSCPFSQPVKGGTPERNLTECELTNGFPTGRFWVDEDLLFNNSEGLTWAR